MIPGGWRAVALELLTRCQLAAGRRAEAERAAAAAAACAEEVGLPMAAAMSALARAALDLDAGNPASAAERALDAAALLDGAGAAFYAATARMLAGRALAQAGEPDRATVELERAAAAFDSFGSAQIPGSGRAGAPQARSPDPPAQPRRARRTTTRRRVAHGTRAGDRAARRRPQDQPRDRRRAVPQPEDRRDAPAQRVPQARRVLARGGRARRRALRTRLNYARQRAMAVAEHFVGRAAELTLFDRFIAELDGGSSVGVELVGEPGIGKTRLLAELAARADSRGHLVLSGSASELEQDLPFWVFVDALDEYLQGLEPGLLDDLEDGVGAELATVFPSLSMLAKGRDVAPQHERYRSHRAVRSLLELLASSQPIVLMLDDLHWCDQASVELLAALLHRPPAAPVLMALAARPRQLGERLSAGLERAYRAGSLTRLELIALTSGEAHELLGEVVARDRGRGSLRGERRQSVLPRAARADRPPGPDGGVPGAGALGRRRRRTAHGDGGAHHGARAALVPELVACWRAQRSPGTRSIPTSPRAAAGVAESATIDALDELLALDIVRPTDVPRRFRFRHPLVRRAVYEAAPGGWRLGAHERTAGALADRGAPASARAHHVESAARARRSRRGRNPA